VALIVAVPSSPAKTKPGENDSARPTEKNVTEQTQSGAERHIETIMRDLDPSSERYRVLDVARRFKSSWVELGQELLRVNRDGLFRQWGYESFREYCSREIRIKQPTAQKLTRAYHYLSREEPELLNRKAELKPLPDYRTIDLLREAREEQGFSSEQYDALRKAVLEDERSHPAVRKQFKEMAAANRSDLQAERTERCKAALAAARRLENSLQPLPDLAGAFMEELSGLIALLQEQVANHEEESDK
jgi:hypothetical protein